MSDLEDLAFMMAGMDKNNEIFTLWFEVTFVRLVLNHVVISNPELAKCLSDDVFEKLRADAKEIIKKRFPMFSIEFSKNKDDQIGEEN